MERERKMQSSRHLDSHRKRKGDRSARETRFKKPQILTLCAILERWKICDATCPDPAFWALPTSYEASPQ